MEFQKAMARGYHYYNTGQYAEAAEEFQGIADGCQAIADMDKARQVTWDDVYAEAKSRNLTPHELCEMMKGVKGPLEAV